MNLAVGFVGFFFFLLQPSDHNFLKCIHYANSFN